MLFVVTAMGAAGSGTAPWAFFLRPFIYTRGERWQSPRLNFCNLRAPFYSLKGPAAPSSLRADSPLGARGERRQRIPLQDRVNRVIESTTHR